MAVTGSRQTGKSTLIEKFARDVDIRMTTNRSTGKAKPGRKPGCTGEQLVKQATSPRGTNSIDIGEGAK